MDQVVRGVHALERRGSDSGPQHVPGDDLGALAPPGGAGIGAAGQAAEPPSIRLERTPQAATDVAARAGEEDEVVRGVSRVRLFGEMREQGPELLE